MNQSSTQTTANSMDHLTDTQLNEYLDQALDSSQKEWVEAHLSICPDCRLRLNTIKQIFMTLANLPERSFARNLKTGVLSNLPNRSSRHWSPFIAAQVGAALGLFIYLAVQIAGLFQLPSLVSVQLPAVSLPAFSFTPPDLTFLAPKLLWGLPNIFSFHLDIPFPTIPSFQLPFTTWEAASLLAVVFLLWMIGNFVLLNTSARVRK